VQRLFRRDPVSHDQLPDPNAHKTSANHVVAVNNEVSVREAMTFHRERHVSVELCMITTADGVTDVNGRSGPLGSDTDRDVLLTLRDNADVVLVGAGTVRAEQYKAPARSPLPIVVVTRSCELDFESSLFTSGWGMIATTIDAPDIPVRTFRAGSQDVDLASIIQQLHNDLNARVIHVEGGPDLNAALLQADLVDAIHVTLSPFLGYGGSTITSALTAQSMPQSQRFELSQLCRDGDYLFARYERSK
jgi:riboflavin biosynthesis pyrimidine reductase